MHARNIVENHQRMRGLLLLLAFSVTLSVSDSAHATLIGDTVAGSLWTTKPSITGVAPFAASAIVDDGVEFSGSLLGSYYQWDVDVDIYSSGFSVEFSSPDGGGGIGGGQGTLLLVDLWSLDWVGTNRRITDVVLSDYSCTGCLPILNGRGLTVWSFGDDSISMYSRVMLNRERFEFDIITEHVIPAPASLPLLILGLSGLGLSRRNIRKHTRKAV